MYLEGLWMLGSSWLGSFCTGDGACRAFYSVDGTEDIIHDAHDEIEGVLKCGSDVVDDFVEKGRNCLPALVPDIGHLEHHVARPVDDLMRWALNMSPTNDFTRTPNPDR